MQSLSQHIYESFSSKNPLIEDLLSRAEPTIEQMVQQSKEWFEKTFERDWSNFEEEMTRLTLTSDMIRSFETYTLPTDKLKDFQIYGSAKGSMTIKCDIEREGQSYELDTEVIYAGGHNIQRLHYRYLTKTALPKQSNSTVYKEYIDKIKRLSKGEKLQKEIDTYKMQISNIETGLAHNSTLTDEQIIQSIKDDPKRNWYEWPTWEEIVKRDAAKNYNNDEAFYYSQKEQDIKSTIEMWKVSNISSKQHLLSQRIKQVAKLESKLAQLISQVN